MSRHMLTVQGMNFILWNGLSIHLEAKGYFYNGYTKITQGGKSATTVIFILYRDIVASDRYILFCFSNICSAY